MTVAASGPCKGLDLKACLDKVEKEVCRSFVRSGPGGAGRMARLAKCWETKTDIAYHYAAKELKAANMMDRLSKVDRKICPQIFAHAKGMDYSGSLKLRNRLSSTACRIVKRDIAFAPLEAIYGVVFDVITSALVSALKLFS